MVEEKLKPKMVALTKMLVSLGAGKVQVLACSRTVRAIHLCAVARASASPAPYLTLASKRSLLSLAHVLLSPSCSPQERSTSGWLVGDKPTYADAAAYSILR